jgi:hypothetical protein
LPTHVRAELQVDEVPGVAQRLALRSRQESRDQVDRAVALEDPVRGDGEGEEDAHDDLHGERSDRERLARARQVLEPVLEMHEHLVLDAGRVVLRLLEVAGLGRDALDAERLLHLVQRPRHGEPQQQADEGEHPQIVERDPDPARHAPLREPLHARPHRRGDDDPQEEQADQQLELPQRERGRDHDHGHGRGDEGSLRGLRG